MKAKVSEDDFLRQVIHLARLQGWRVAHFRPGRTAHRWVTAVQADGAGFPDLMLLREHQLVVAELKVGRNRPTPEQDAWLEAFEDVACVTFVGVWTPEDWDEIEKTLRREP